MKHEDTILELERILERVNDELKRILLTVHDSDVAKELRKVERLSRWKRGFFENGATALPYVIARAKLKAEEFGETFVVASDVAAARLVLVPKARFLKDKPFGLGPKDVVFETDETGEAGKKA